MVISKESLSARNSSERLIINNDFIFRANLLENEYFFIAMECQFAIAKNHISFIYNKTKKKERFFFDEFLQNFQKVKK